MPKAVFGSISPDKIPADTNLKPIGSGPFLLDKYDQTQVNLKRNDNYWGKTAFGTPPMTTINHPIFKSNNDGDLKLESGEIDASQQFTAQIWKMWEAGKPVGIWMKKKPYYVPGQIPLLIFNLNKPGLENPKVRLAIAYGIDYPNIATTAMSDYSEPANASLIIPTGYESKFYDSAAVQSEGWTFDKAKAIEILEGDLKAKKGSDGIYELPDGTKLGGWKLITPTGWTDWNTACEIVAKSAKDIRHRHQHRVPTVPDHVCQARRTATSTWQCTTTPASTRPARGSASATHWMTAGCRQYGKTAFWNYNRFKNAEVAAHVDAAAGGEVRCRGQDGVLGSRQDLSREHSSGAADVPSAGRSTSSTQSNWENFPTEENPYAPPMWQGAGIQWLFKIKKVGT